jgi:8-oxo-dGTP pyrophosphatase MutT (NUDIX family)
MVFFLALVNPELSVILARPVQGSNSYQLLLVERMARDGSQYLNATVFPGGQLEPGDNGNLRRAALRELYEEANIHLRPDFSNPGRVIAEQVNEVTSVPYVEYLVSTGGKSAEDCLIPFSQWVTPKVMHKRFDSYFFIALCSPVDNPANGKVDGKEIKSLAWRSPSEALAQFSDGKIIWFPPQWYFL